MLFIRCRDGVSHNPAEHVEDADAEARCPSCWALSKLGANMPDPRSLAKSTRPSAC
jgi:allantoate deiminase